MRLWIPLSGRGLFLAVGGLLLTVGLVFAVTGIQDAIRARALEERGEVVQAVVVKKSIQRASRQGNPSTQYQIVYRFVTPDGRPFEGMATVPVERWESLAPGAPFTVRYLPEAADSSRAEGSSDLESALVMTGLGSLLSLVGGILFLRTASRLWRDRRLLREGRTAPGTVVAIEPSNVAVNRVRQWQLRYRYQDHLGRPQEGTSGPWPPETVDALNVGDSLTVRFDREHPEQSLWDRAATPAPEAAAPEASAPEAAPPEASPPSRSRSFLRRVGSFAVMLGLLFVAMVAGEAVPALKEAERLIARHQAALLAMTISMTVAGFLLFMAAILGRVFRGAGQPMSHADIEDQARRLRLESGPAVARVSAYRFRGRSAGSSFADKFTLREAKEAWRQGAWRTSLRWRTNFLAALAGLAITLGVFGLVIVLAPMGIKLLFAAGLAYAALRTVSAVVRA